MHATAGTFDPGTLKQVQSMLTSGGSEWQVNRYNVYRSATRKAKRRTMPVYEHGRIERRECLVRGERTLPLGGVYLALLDAIDEDGRIDRVMKRIARSFGGQSGLMGPQQLCIQALEVMLLDGWVVGRLDRNVPRLTVKSADEESIYVHWNRDEAPEASASN